MFRLSREDLQRRRAAKLIQTTKEIIEALGFEDLVKPGVKVEILTAFHEVFELYAFIVNPEGGGDRVFAFDAHCLMESMCRTWANLYGSIATSREEVLKDKALLKQEFKSCQTVKTAKLRSWLEILMCAVNNCGPSRICL